MSAGGIVDHEIDDERRWFIELAKRIGESIELELAAYEADVLKRLITALKKVAAAHTTKENK